MGASARARARAEFDWMVIMRKFKELVSELAGIRRAATGFDAVRGDRRTSPTQADPFTEFAGYATKALKGSTVLRSRPGADATRLARLRKVELNQVGSSLRADDEAERLLALVATNGRLTVQEALAPFDPARHRPLLLTIMWLCKLGLLDWDREQGEVG
jgi:hypothetical protein